MALLVLSLPLTAHADPAAACEQAILAAERETGLPPGLLLAVALAESGRRDPASGRLRPWPWTVVSAELADFLPDREAAMALARSHQAAGRRNVDVGCLQINLGWHPDAFADLAEALDPRRNAGYAARFLASLHAEAGDWDTAVARYHSRDADRGQAYRSRVYAHLARLEAPPLPPSGAPPAALRDAVRAANRCAAAGLWRWLGVAEPGGCAAPPAPVAIAGVEPPAPLPAAVRPAAAALPPRVVAGPAPAARPGAVRGMVLLQPSPGGAQERSG
jgi:hypothetical protein